jgi:hypothetical protein
MSKLPNPGRYVAEGPAAWTARRCIVISVLQPRRSGSVRDPVLRLVPTTVDRGQRARIGSGLLREDCMPRPLGQKIRVRDRE